MATVGFIRRTGSRAERSAGNSGYGQTASVCAGSGKEKRQGMKHRVTVEVEAKKHFLGIPYKTTEKKRIMVDGKTFRKMKQEEQNVTDRMAAEALACAAVVWEEEMVDMFGE